MTHPILEVSLDNGATYVPAPHGVRIIWREAGEEDAETQDLHLRATYEGVITDLVGADSGEVYGTAAYDLSDDLVNTCQ